MTWSWSPELLFLSLWLYVESTRNCSYRSWIMCCTTQRPPPSQRWQSFSIWPDVSRPVSKQRLDSLIGRKVVERYPTVSIITYAAWTPDTKLWVVLVMSDVTAPATFTVQYVLVLWCPGWALHQPKASPSSPDNATFDIPRLDTSAHFRPIYTTLRILFALTSACI